MRLSHQLIAAVLALPALISLVEAAQDRPNILWITSEDNSVHWLGCYGNEDAKTPHIDRLAAAGVRFKYGYANAPVCAVARNTIITGRYACSLGTHNMRSRYPIPEDVRTYVSYLRQAGYYCVNRSKTDYNFKTDDKSHWDQCDDAAHWKNRKEGQPFFAVFNSLTSHESCLFEEKLASSRKDGLIPETPSRDPASVKLPRLYPDTPEIRQDWATYMDVVTAMDRRVGDWLQELDEAGLRENTIVFYYADHGGILPRAKRYLYDTGTHVPMIVNVPKKWAHLAPGEPGTASGRPVSFIDLPPTVLSLAGVEVPEAMHGRAFMGAGKRAPEPYVFLFGQRFDSRMLRFVRGITDGRYRYIRNFHPYRHRGILTGYAHGQVGWQALYELRQQGKLTATQSSYWVTPQPVEELYDTRADPWELHNLAGDAKHRARLESMRDATLNKMREIVDTGLVPESMYESICKDGTIYDYVHSEDFPYEEVLQMALIAGDGRDNAQQTLRAAMEHAHPVIRYWGALGCRIQGDSSSQTIRGLKKLLTDPTEGVRVVAAEALYVAGEEQMGFQGLLEILRETQDTVVSLEALNITQALGVMEQVSSEDWMRACRVGKYSKLMAGDHPSE